MDIDQNEITIFEGLIVSRQHLVDNWGYKIKDTFPFIEQREGVNMKLKDNPAPVNNETLWIDLIMPTSKDIVRPVISNIMPHCPNISVE
jgi:hypothetical protein